MQSSLRGWERSADPRGRVYWGLRGVVPVSPRVTRRSPPFPVLSVISTSPQHLDSHRCCGLSSVWPRIPDGQSAFVWGSCGLRKVRAYRQQWLSFYLGVVLPARGAPHHPPRKWPFEHLLARLPGVAVLRLCPCGGRRSSEETHASGARGCSSLRWNNSSFPKHFSFSHTSVSSSGNRPQGFEQVFRLNRN